MSWAVTFWYKTREDWEAGNARCADVRGYDDHGRLVEQFDVEVGAASEATKGLDADEVVDEYAADYAYSQVCIDDSVARELKAKKA